MRAIWGEDYDYIMDKCYPTPVCPECEEPIGKKKDGLYHCFSCGKVVEIADEDIKEWFAEREGEKIEMKDCVLGCGGKKCVETHYVKNPVSKEWQTAWGVCTRCGRRFIV